ncbi:MAG: hypothetical protein LBU32_22155 [Clostridiales bacterium]|jgi:hypothetical protein|nr:hypothetical protein [Clostridiales bacterium]
MKTHSDAPSEEELRKRLGRRPAPPAPAQANPSEEQKLSNELYYARYRLQLEIVRKNPEIEVVRKFEPDLQAFLSKACGSRSGEPCRGAPRRRRPACGTAPSAW